MKTTFTTTGTPCIILNYGKQALPAPEIQYIVGEGNYSLIRTKADGLLTSSFTMRLFSNSLETFNNFFSPRKGLLLNVDYLEKVYLKEGTYYAMMADGQSHILSRRKGKAFLYYLLENELDSLINLP